MFFNTINVCENGVDSDSEIVQTDKIQKVIDSLKDTGGVIYFPKGKYITGTLRLYSYITLYLESGAEILGSENPCDYDGEYVGAIEAPSFSKCLIYAENCKKITITGNGAIDGRSVDFGEERPMLMRFVNCTEILFENINLKNAGSWGVHFIACEFIHIRGIDINSRVNFNNDGLDFDSCKNVFISDTHISSSDDSICLKSTKKYQGENFVITNCILSSDTAAIKFGTSSYGGFKNVVISDCVIHDCCMGTIKLIMVDGGVLENVNINNIVMDNVGSPLFIRIGNRNLKYESPREMDFYGAGEAGGGDAGIIRNISISDIQASVTVDKIDRTPIMITGIPQSCVEDVTLRNIKASFPGGGTEADAHRDVPEDEARYPEQWFFGVLPAWGMYARHVRGLKLDNVQLTLAGDDRRKEIVLEDVELSSDLHM